MSIISYSQYYYNCKASNIEVLSYVVSVCPDMRELQAKINKLELYCRLMLGGALKDVTLESAKKIIEE